MQQVVGHCGKCGAPYTQETGPWWGITPPPLTPTCSCWNVPVIVTTTGTEPIIVQTRQENDE